MYHHEGHAFGHDVLGFISAIIVIIELLPIMYHRCNSPHINWAPTCNYVQYINMPVKITYWYHNGKYLNEENWKANHYFTTTHSIYMVGSAFESLLLGLSNARRIMFKKYFFALLRPFKLEVRFGAADSLWPLGFPRKTLKILLLKTPVSLVTFLWKKMLVNKTSLLQFSDMLITCLQGMNDPQFIATK